MKVVFSQDGLDWVHVCTEVQRSSWGAASGRRAQELPFGKADECREALQPHERHAELAFVIEC